MSVTSHRLKGRKPMANKEINFNLSAETDFPELPPRETDAQMAARWATEALRDGRFELGRVLANLAAAAHKAETHARERTSPMVGQSQPLPESDRTPTYATVSEPADTLAQPFDGPSDNGDADLHAIQSESDTSTAVLPAYAGDAKTEIFGRPAEPKLEVPGRDRCAAEIVHIRGNEKYTEPCRGPIWYHVDGANSAWQHVDPAIDMHHWAQPDRTLE